MVNTDHGVNNELAHLEEIDHRAGLGLPELIHLATEEARRIPAPGTQRALKAETGRTFDQMCGPEADGADRIQTLIWMKLRRQYPGLRWSDCDDVDVQVEEGALDVDPTKLVGSAGTAGFCRFWRMSPTEVYDMDDLTYHAFVAYQRDELRARERAARSRRR